MRALEGRFAGVHIVWMLTVQVPDSISFAVAGVCRVRLRLRRADFDVGFGIEITTTRFFVAMGRSYYVKACTPVVSGHTLVNY